MKLPKLILVGIAVFLVSCASAEQPREANGAEDSEYARWLSNNCSNIEYLRTDLYKEIVPATISNLPSDGLQILTSNTNIYLDFGGRQAVLWRGNCIPFLDYYQIQSLVFRSQISTPLTPTDENNSARVEGSFDIKLDLRHPLYEANRFAGGAEVDQTTDFDGSRIPVYLSLWHNSDGSTLGLYKPGMLTADNEVGFTQVTAIVKSKTKLKTFYFFPYPDANGGTLWVVQEVAGGIIVYAASYNFSRF